MRTRAHRAHIQMLIGKLRRGHDLDVSTSAIEQSLGYPLAEASPENLRGVIAGLEGALEAAREAVTR